MVESSQGDTSATAASIAQVCAHARVHACQETDPRPLCRSSQVYRMVPRSTTDAACAAAQVNARVAAVDIMTLPITHIMFFHFYYYKVLAIFISGAYNT